jgi:hypothetical protein
MRKRQYAAGLLVATLWAAGCTHLPPAAESQPPAVTSPGAAVPEPSAAALPFGSAAEDPQDGPCIKTTHGCIALNPDVDEDTIDATICVSGYTKSVRPATSYTNGVKKKLLREAGIDEARIGDYELDHIVPLELGGHPRKLSNLVLQPWDGEHGATVSEAMSSIVALSDRAATAVRRFA